MLMAYRGGKAVKTKVVFPRKECEKAAANDGHESHLWQELHISTGNPLVEHTQWWQCGEPK